MAALTLTIMAVPMAYAVDDVLQCVPYARTVSGIDIRGDALNWWDQAEGRYDRGQTPRKGAVMSFRPYGPMTLGHVAVVSKILGSREILIRHANWSSPGAIEEDVLARDVSETGDWSEVKVWHSPTGQMGARVNPVNGFIYAPKARLHPFDPERDGGNVRFARLTPAPSDASKPTAIVQLASITAMPGNRRLEVSRDIFRIALGSDAPTAGTIGYRSARKRTLADIIAEVKKNAEIS